MPNHKAKWLEVIYWLKDNFTEPVWSDFDKLNETFDMKSTETRKDKMTLYILCKNLKLDHTDKEASARRFQRWYSANESYLPVDLRGLMKNAAENGCTHPDHLSEETKEALSWFDEWMVMMYDKIQMDLTSNYLANGAKRYFDVLERRFRKEWGINKETTIETKKQDKNEEITVRFVEA